MQPQLYFPKEIKKKIMQENTSKNSQENEQEHIKNLMQRKLNYFYVKYGNWKNISEQTNR